jgi:hypothetical protein
VSRAADGLRPFSIPSDSPLARGWGRTVAELLERHGVHEVLDVLSAYAELRCRHEPDNCSNAEEAAQGGWFSWLTWRAAAQRRIEAVEIPRGPGRPRLD